LRHAVARLALGRHHRERISFVHGQGKEEQMSTAAQPSRITVRAPNEGTKVPDRDNWAVTPITKAKDAYATPSEWLAGALHHKICKEKLSSIAEQVALSYNSSTPALRAAVRAFWSQCWVLAGPQVTAAVVDAEPKTSPHRLLWNLPINVSLGPPNPATDPDQAFDADTEPNPDAPGTRRLDGVSTVLAELEQVWDAAGARRGGRGDYTDHALWNRMTALLLEAHKAADAAARGDRLLYPPKVEQWLYDSLTKQHLRKGLTEYLDAAAGAARFRQARLNAPGIAAHQGSAKVAATGQATASLGDGEVILNLAITEGTLHHVCERHTFTFFDFAGPARPVNTFWPDIADFAAATVRAAELAPHLARLCLDHLIHHSHAEPAEWMGEEIELAQLQADRYCVYVHVSIEEAEETAPGEYTVQAAVRTFAPNGASGPGLLCQDLDTIGRALGLIH
jgi:hypothetical protein